MSTALVSAEAWTIGSVSPNMIDDLIQGLIEANRAARNVIP